MTAEHPTRNDLFSDAAAVEYGLREAELDERPIDDATARRTAMQLHSGQWSAFYSLGSCGAIHTEAIRDEFIRGTREHRDDEEALRWLGALFTYALNHEDRLAQTGWHELTADDRPVVAWLEVQS